MAGTMLTRAEIPGLVCTALLMALGVSLASWYWRSWKQGAAESPTTLPALRVQYLRRSKMAMLIAIEGVLLCLGDTVLPVMQRMGTINPRQMAVLWTLDVLVMLGVAFWLAILALRDLAASIALNRRVRQQTLLQEKSLCEELNRFREMREDSQC
ncbi:MAG: hypothetical protein DWH81_00870 [Planctomycetota bacterium]|nr:MAG: hypothetical protein DWH81_00870 [Planctomycetota bacterium]